MTFLLDPPILGLVGLLAGARIVEDRRQVRVVAFVTGVFLVASVLLYLDVVPFWVGRWIAGSDWMLNSGLGTDLSRSAGTDVLAAIMLVSYPLWAWVGLDVGRRLAKLRPGGRSMVSFRLLEAGRGFDGPTRRAPD